MRLSSVVIASLFAISSISVSYAQTEQAERVTVNALFEYPVAPDSIDGLTAKSNYLMQHFWDRMDFKQKIVDQTALTHAFGVYAIPMMWADESEVYASVDKLLASMSKNPSLMYQFVKAAENKIYSQSAETWIDEVYIKMLKALLKQKKLTDARKSRYTAQLKVLEATQPGQPIPTFKYIDRSGTLTNFVSEKKWTLICFSKLGDYDCSMSRLKMDSDLKLDNLVKNDDVRVYYIFTDIDSSDDWQSECVSYPHYWTVGASSDASNIYDMRMTPAFYVVSPEGKIEAKNINVQQALELLKSKL